MDLRQVALGAVFGAAVAVNAALQSLQDAGSFLIRSPSYSKTLPAVGPSFSGSRRSKRTLCYTGPGEDEIDLSNSVDVLDVDDEEDDDDARGGSGSEEQFSLLSTRTPLIDTSASFAGALATSESESFDDVLTVSEAARFNAALAMSETDTLKSYYGQKLQVKRKTVEASLADYDESEFYLKGSDEENSSTEDGDREWEYPSTSMNMNKKRKLQGPVFLPLLPQMIHSEEAMSAMLQNTTNTVLATLSDARKRRERMLLEMESVDRAEKQQTSLQLVSRFIDALVNVSDSLKIVHSALFSKENDPHILQSEH